MQFAAYHAGRVMSTSPLAWDKIDRALPDSSTTGRTETLTEADYGRLKERFTPSQACDTIAREPAPIAHCDYAGGRFEVTEKGVVFCNPPDEEGSTKPPIWICSPLRVVAQTRDGKSAAWGRLLEWDDSDRVRHSWAMPNELLQRDGGVEVRCELAHLGLRISTTKQARDLLSAYIQVFPVNIRARCVDHMGWHGPAYVLSSESIGETDERIVFQNAHATEPAFSVSGTAEEWASTVAMLATGNSRMVFSICAAFAGALLEPAGEDSGGFHQRGPSSIGKSTSLKVSASVWGSPEKFCRAWRATTNGLEGLAALHSDGLLILDELSQMDPREAGEAAYLLGNGRGKERATRTGTARQPSSWRLLFLSAGEESLSTLMARAGKKPTAGQEVRLTEIDADAGAGMGAIEELHGYNSPAAFVAAIRDAASKYYGAAGIKWLRRLVADRDKLPAVLADGIRRFVAEVAPKGATGQTERVARRFGLVAVAGEIATRYGLTGWEKGESSTAASKCFASWLDLFGGTDNREERALLTQVRAFLEAHGQSRFQDLSSEKQYTVNRAGFFRANAEGNREFLILPQAFKQEVCKGFDPKLAKGALLRHGWLLPGGDRPAQKVRPAGMGPTWVYVLSARIWEGDE
jgi:uncharacterized protein (DUF927 family)